MNRYTFSSQSGKAYYCNSIPGFIKDHSTNIVGQLVRHAFEINKEQSDAWENQIQQLQRRLEVCGMEGDVFIKQTLASSVNLDKFTHFARWAESQTLKNIDRWSMAARSF